jgi:hypothetical protein
MAQAHRMAATVPDVEIADHRHPPAFGAHTAKRTPSTPSTVISCAQAAAQVAVIAFGEQV